MRKIIENPIAKWGSIATIVMAVLAIGNKLLSAKDYVDDEIERSEVKAANTYATKESVGAIKDDLTEVKSDVKTLLQRTAPRNHREVAP